MSRIAYANERFRISEAILWILAPTVNRVLRTRVAKHEYKGPWLKHASMEYVSRFTTTRPC